MDICIFQIIYPNDPTKKLKPHQHFIGYIDKELMLFYSISSILNKEYKVFSKDGTPNKNYYILDYDVIDKCNLKTPSFIDCSKSYSLSLNNTIDINKLSNRMIPFEIREQILLKIKEVKENGNHIEYSINISEFKKFNSKCVLK